MVPANNNQDDQKSSLYATCIGFCSLTAPFCFYRIYKSLLRMQKTFGIQSALEDQIESTPGKYCMVAGTAQFANL